MAAAAPQRRGRRRRARQPSSASTGTRSSILLRLTSALQQKLASMQVQWNVQHSPHPAMAGAGLRDDCSAHCVLGYGMGAAPRSRKGTPILMHTMARPQRFTTLDAGCSACVGSSGVRKYPARGLQF